jgi:hypothetical protein
VGANTDIWTARLTWSGEGPGGLNLTNLTNSEGFNSFAPAIAPYGTSTNIVFSSLRDGYALELYQIPGDGSGPAVRRSYTPYAGELQEIDPDVNIAGNLAWSIGPASGAAPAAIWVQDAAGTTHLTGGASNLDRHPVWSPFSTQIAFDRTVSGSTNIYRMNADGSNLVPLTTSGMDAHPTWSPDGSQIAFQSKRGGTNAIWKMKADGSSQMKVTTATTDDVDPHWIWDDSVGMPRVYVGAAGTDEGHDPPFGSTPLQAFVGGAGSLGLRCNGTASAVIAQALTGAAGPYGLQLHTPDVITYLGEDAGPGSAPITLIQQTAPALFVGNFNNVMVFLDLDRAVAILPWWGSGGVVATGVGGRGTGAPVITTRGNTVTVTGKVLRLADRRFFAGFVSDAKPGRILSWK